MIWENARARLTLDGPVVQTELNTGDGAPNLALAVLTHISTKDSSHDHTTEGGPHEALHDRQ